MLSFVKRKKMQKKRPIFFKLSRYCLSAKNFGLLHSILFNEEEKNMGKHTIQISDDDGKTFKIVVSIGLGGSSMGNWRSLDYGRIRYTQGRAEHQNCSDDVITFSLSGYLNDMVLFDSPQSQKYGLRLNEYSNIFGIKDQGMGYVWQPWVLDLKPSRISWVLID